MLFLISALDSLPSKAQNGTLVICCCSTPTSQPSPIQKCVISNPSPTLGTLNNELLCTIFFQMRSAVQYGSTFNPRDIGFIFVQWQEATFMYVNMWFNTTVRTWVVLLSKVKCDMFFLLLKYTLFHKSFVLLADNPTAPCFSEMCC